MRNEIEAGDRLEWRGNWNHSGVVSEISEADINGSARTMVTWVADDGTGEWITGYDGVLSCVPSGMVRIVKPKTLNERAADCAATRTNGIVDCAQCGQSVDRVATATVAWAPVCRPCLKSALDSIGRVEWAAFETALQDLTAARSSSPERQRFDAAFGAR